MSVIDEILSDIFEDDAEPAASGGGKIKKVTDSFFDDDRHFCKECKKFSASRSYCFVQRCNIIDDLKRRCVDFESI